MAISGYRALTLKEESRINRIKAIGNDLQDEIDAVRTEIATDMGYEDSEERNEAMRWLAIAKTDLQKGMMAMIRSIARPKGF